MAGQATQSQAAAVYGGITRQIASQTPGGAILGQFGNVGGGRPSSSYYSSRVRQSQTNGAGPTIDPITAPWSFSDFVFGGRSLAKTTGTKLKPKSRWQQLTS